MIKLIKNNYIRRGGRLVRRLMESTITQLHILKIPGLNGLLKRIAHGEEINSDNVLPSLCQESKEDRVLINFKLAEALFNMGNCKQATVFIQRAWIFSGLNEKYLPLFISIHAAIGDVEAIRAAHKSIGMRTANEHKTIETLKHFNSWQYAYANHNHDDEYHYDLEILNRIALLARPHAFQVKKSQPIKNRKVRLANLMFGMTHTNSVIVKNSLSFAQFHDQSKFEVTFFIPEQNAVILKWQEAIENIAKIKSLGYRVVTAPDSDSEEKSLIGLARLIYESDPDILITNAALADLRHYFITSLRPAPLIVGLCQGPPPQFIAPDFNWSISWTKHPMIDCPTDCSLVNGGAVLPERQYSREEAKSFFGMPQENLVVMSCGRPQKFQDLDFWNEIIKLLQSYPDVYYVVVGLVAPPTWLQDALTPDIIGRMKFFGWEKDFLKLLSMADVVVDTYPSGGGMTIVDAMSLGTPVVSFKNNYMKIFSQTDWSPAEEFMGITELLVERGDFEQFRKLLSKLLANRDFRISMSELSRKRIISTSGSPEDMVRECEQVFLKVIEKHSGSSWNRKAHQ